MTSFEVAQTIREQLKFGGMMKVWSWGANAWKHGNDKMLGYDANFLQFRVTGHHFQGRVRVYHNSMDEYTVLFLAVQSDTEKMPRIDAWCENLTSVIDEKIEKIPTYKY